MDHMFCIMEKYANSLEMIVSERTALLQEERRRADSLLYQMMPRQAVNWIKSDFLFILILKVFKNYC